MREIKALLFDWGDTVMKDSSQKEGPMCYWDEVEVVTGIKEAISQLSKKYICILGSNAGQSDAKLMGKAIERVGLLEYFEYLYTSQELGYKKPDIQFFIEISKRVNIKTENIVMIGNDYIKDISGSKKAGMKTVYFNQNINSNEINEMADKEISSMFQLVEAIEAIKQ